MSTPDVRQALAELVAAKDALAEAKGLSPKWARGSDDIPYTKIIEIEGHAEDRFDAAWDAARAALAEQPAGVAEGWLPIETAPKGCASILCGAGGYMIGDWGIYCRHNHPKFTHWMPLPAAPKPEDTNGAA